MHKCPVDGTGTNISLLAAESN